MSAKTGIQWTDATWNPVVGCTQVSPGCAHCYAKSLHDMRHTAYLAGKALAAQYAEPFEVVQLKPERLTVPLSWRKPKRIFVNSVSDLFHDDVPDAYIARVWAVMMLADRHTFQVLTKRPARMQALLSSDTFMDSVLDAAEEFYPLTRRDEDSHGYLDWCSWVLGDGLDGGSTSWIWLGVSVENQHFADERIPLLLQTPAAVRFLSCEPLLGPVDLTVVYRDPMDEAHGISVIGNDELHWVIIGGESGKGARTFRLEWAESLIDQCARHGVAKFMKQIGGRAFTGGVIPQPYSIGGHGDDMERWPNGLRVREFPAVAR